MTAAPENALQPQKEIAASWYSPLKSFQQGAFLGQDCIEQNCRFSAPIAAWRYAGMRLEYALEMTLISETQPVSNIRHIMT